MTEETNSLPTTDPIDKAAVDLRVREETRSRLEQGVGAWFLVSVEKTSVVIDSLRAEKAGAEYQIEEIADSLLGPMIRVRILDADHLKRLMSLPGVNSVEEDVEIFAEGEETGEVEP